MAPFSSEEVLVPFIPDEIDSEPVIPNTLYILKPYRFRPNRGAWKHITCSEDGSNNSVNSRSSGGRRNGIPPAAVRIVTWNVDLRRELSCERMSAVLRHLETEVLCNKKEGKGKSSEDEPEACVVLLQEVNPEAFKHLLKDEWVREKFAVLPVHPEKWPEDASYGNVTLVSRDLEVVQAQIIHFGLSRQQRTGVAVYLRMSAPGDGQRSRVICIVNTHLESLPEGESARPKQLEMLSRFLKQDRVDGGVIAGDMNAISRADRKIVSDAGLKDAWRRGDKDIEGYTWGFQSPAEDSKFPSGRLDKVLYLPRRGYEVEEPRRIGVGVKVKRADGGYTWASDHYGLITTLRI